MDRRQFMQRSLAVAAASALPFDHYPVLAAAATEDDWSLGWQSVNVDHLAPTALRIEGTLPTELRGNLFRNGPARVERNGVRYRHWFDGDGMVQRFEISADAVTHEGRFVQTHKYQREQAADRFLYSAAGTKLPDSEAAGDNDTANTANIALLPWDDELLALWEGGSAYRMDPDSLETLGRKDWRDDLIHMPFSAHPLTEPDGTLWNFGSAPYIGENGKLFVYRIAPRQGVEAVQAIDLPMASYMHSFAMSASYLIFYLGPHRYQRGAETFVDSFSWTPDLGSKILLVDKNDLTRQRWFDAPPGFVFHCAQAFERGPEVVVDLCLYPSADIMQSGMIELMAGPTLEDYPDFPRAVLTSLRLNTNTGRVASDSVGTLLEFPGIDPRLKGQRSAVFGVGHGQPLQPHYADTVVRVDADSGRLSQYTFPAGHIVEEPLFVPRDGRDSSAGWLLGSFLDVRRKETGLYVLDANRLEDGPQALARMERSLPLGFHGCFMSA